MCMYCDMTPDGDIPADRESLIYEEFGEILGQKVAMIGDIFQGKFEIEIAPFSVLSGKTIEIQIKYCPMCGRKLKGES